MIFAIATKNKPKIEACKAVIHRIYSNLYDHSRPEFFWQNTSSGVPDMPLSQGEMMIGARNRATKIYDISCAQRKSIAFSIGLEGGFHHVQIDRSKKSVCFLQSWVYVFNGRDGFWGSSGSVPVPEAVSDAVIEQKRELARVIDQFSGENDVRSRMGAVGIFTKGIVNRQDLFENALEFAFAPFYNPGVYHSQWKSTIK